MSKAWCLVRDQPVYRREAFIAGLKAAAYDFRQGGPIEVKPGDVCVGWNRYWVQHDLACQIEKAGGIYICAENAYVGLDRSNRQRYAMAIGYHNGRTPKPLAGSPERWQALGIQLQPWKAGRHVLVSANRSFGTPGGIMPDDWMVQVRDRLKKLTQRPVVFRAHPGNDKPKRPFSADLEGAHCVVIWSSSTGCEALIAGVPVICLAPWWICKDAADSKLESVELPTCDDAKRLAAFERLAWAQWHVSEIANGTAFRELLSC